MATSTTLRSWWAEYRCATSKMVRVAFPGDGRTWDLLVAEEAAPAWRRFADLMTEHNYLFLESAGGTYNCRKISGTNSWSLHSYGTAVDLNPSKNPYSKPLKHNYPQSFIDAVLAEKALDGTPLFRWGGTWMTPGAMHWEINCKPTAIPPYEGGDEVEVQELIKNIQAAINSTPATPKLAEDGVWGVQTQNRLQTVLGQGYVAAGTPGPKGDPGPAGKDGKPATLTIKGDVTIP